MKNFLTLIFIWIFFQTPCFAIETEETLESQEPTLFEKIQNIKAKEITDTNKTSYLLEDVLTKKIESGIIETVHPFAYFRGGLDLDITNDDEDFVVDYNSISTGINGKFKDGNTNYELWLRFNPQRNAKFFQYMPSNIYISNTSIPHHTLMLGHFRTPTGVEGGKSMTTLPLINRSQIGRNFGNMRKVGLRVKGNYDLIEYDLGGYSSDRYFHTFFPGAEFSGWTNLKPLGKTDGKYGKLVIGGGLSAGQNQTNYVVSGLYAGYEYKNLFADFEYASANGYNGGRTISTNHADGFYTTLGYKVTPKLQLLGRYDQYTPDKKISNDIRREYSAGINYFIKGQALKLMLNYVFCQNDLTKDSHRIIFGTQIIL